MADDGELKRITLTKSGDRVIAQIDEGDPVAVKVVWLRPVSGRGEEISLVGIKDQEEFAMIDSLDRLDDTSRRVAEKELEACYLIPRIDRVLKAEVNFGNRYLLVETDLGRVEFMLRDPNTNVIYLTEDHLFLRDSMGNRYEIQSLAALDDHSRTVLDKAL